MHIILIHLGDKKIDHLNDCLKQIFLFNKDINIYLLAKPKIFKTLKKSYKSRINYIDYKQLELTEEHKKFKLKNKLDNKFFKGFWLHTTERFFYLENISNKFKLKDIFHIENDCMIYFSIKKNIDLFRDKYNIGIVPESNKNSIPVFIYFKNYQNIKKLTNFFYKNHIKFLNNFRIFRKFLKIKNDMQLLHSFLIENLKKNKILNLPTTNSYLNLNEKRRLFDYSKNFKNFKAIFDPSYLGLKLDGLDKTFKGFKKIDKSIFIRPPFYMKNFEIKFFKRKKLKTPFLINKHIKIRIMNLHIHSKNLKKFIS